MISKPKPEKKEKKKRKPVKKVSSRGALIKKAHKIMREIVIERDGGCVCPPPENGHSDVLQAGHIIPSTKSGVRFDLYNVHCQCHSCNGRHEYYEYFYVDWFLQKFGAVEHHRIKEDADGLLKAYEVEEIIEQLTQIRCVQTADPDFLPYFTQKQILSSAWTKAEWKWREK